MTDDEPEVELATQASAGSNLHSRSPAPRERRRPSLAAVVVTVAVTAALTVAGVIVTRPHASSHGSSALVSARGLLIVEGSTHKLCAGRILFVLGGTCGDGIPLDISAVDLPKAVAAAATSTSPDVGVVGYWDGSLLTVEKVVSADLIARPTAPTASLKTGCSHPGSTASFDPKAASTAIDWAKRQTDYADSWQSAGGRVVNVAFAGSSQERDSELHRRYAGPLCIVLAKYSESRIEQLRRQLSDHAVGATGWQIPVSGTVGSGVDSLGILVVYASDADVAAIRAQTIPELVVLSELQPVAHDSPLRDGIR